MAHFFLSIPGVVATVGLGVLILARGRGRAAGASRTLPPRPLMPIIVSAVMLCAGLWILLSGRYDADTVHWAAGSVGTVVGYWLKP